MNIRRPYNTTLFANEQYWLHYIMVGKNALEVVADIAMHA